MARKKKTAKPATKASLMVPLEGAKPNTPPKRGGWNPKYDPSWCEDVLAYGSEGMSRREIALELRVGRTTLYKAMEDNPEFALAMAEADYLSQAWWERQGRFGVNKGVQQFNAGVLQFMLKNRAKDDYGDNSKLTIDIGAGFLKFIDAARNGEFKTPKPEYLKLVSSQ